MPSSISSSEAGAAAQAKRSRPARPGFDSWVFMGCAVILYLLAESVANFGTSHVSRIYGRIASDRASVLLLRHAAAGEPETIAFFGNSLLLDGLNLPLLRERVNGRYRPARLVIEQTNYYDWYFGLKRLFREGMRPDVVIVSMNAPQTTFDGTLGEYSARLLFDARDIPEIARRTGLNLTAESSMAFAHFSAFYSARTTLREILINRSVPPVMEMWHEITANGPAHIPADDQLVPQLAPRLRELSALCSQFGATFMFLNTPTMQSGDTALVEAGGEAGVRVLRPVPNSAFPRAYYKEDRFHLNATGSRLFTNALADELLRQ